MKEFFLYKKIDFFIKKKNENIMKIKRECVAGVTLHKLCKQADLDIW